MAKQKVDMLIIGAGVIGLAIAAELSGQNRFSSIALIEKNDSFGRETSSRNSEVIHAGIYYPTGSLKARLCIEGSQMLYSFCNKWNIAHLRIGKLIVAGTAEDYLHLDQLYAQAKANGVADLQLLDAQQVSGLEPHIRAGRALFSPSTGIIDSHSLMARLEQLALQNVVLPAYCHQVRGIEPLSDGYRVFFKNPDGSSDVIECSILVNCAGLEADSIAALAGIDPVKSGYRQHLCKGEYFSIPSAKADLVNHLIYPPPLPRLIGLGIHATKAIDGRLRLGPNTIYIDQVDYSVEPGHADHFYKSVKNFLPFLEAADLEPEMAGIRPKLSGPDDPFRDFVIAEESGRGLPGMINLVGIDSPGLTCCLSIARLVSSLI